VDGGFEVLDGVRYQRRTRGYGRPSPR
jgi:hypothetical protein